MYLVSGVIINRTLRKMIWYWSNGNYDQSMNYMWISDIYFYTTYNLSVYDISYKTLDHTYPGIVNAAEKGEYTPTNKYMELESNSLFTLSSTHTEK